MNTRTERDETSGNNSRSSPVVADGHARAVDGILQAVLSEIRKAVEAKYAADMSKAGALRRVWIRMRMNREIKRRLVEEIEKKAPPDALYGVN